MKTLFGTMLPAILIASVSITPVSAEDCQYTLNSGDIIENMNIILNGTQSGVCADNVKDITIRNVNFISAGAGSAVHITNSEDVTITNSTAQVSGAGARIFWLDNVTDSTFSNNIIKSNGASHLLRIDNSSALHIESNQFTTVSDASDNVRLFESSDLTFAGNTFNSTRGFGFLLGDQGQVNTIGGLVFTENTFNGNSVFFAVKNTHVTFITEKSIDNTNNTSKKTDGGIYANQGEATYTGKIQFK